MANLDPYFLLPQVSNSDLNWLAEFFMNKERRGDREKAYRFGSLLDAMITEKDRIDYYKRTCDGEIFSKEEFCLAEEMKKAFYRDKFCAMLADHGNTQSVIVNTIQVEYEEFIFEIEGRCKFDIDATAKLAMTADIKSTAAKTLKQFIEACEYFDYFQQRAWYMDLHPKRPNKDILIGISKHTMEVFKVPVVRGGDYYNIGKAKYSELAFRWNYLFGDVSKTRVIEIEQLKEAV